jgi:acyl-CoA thioester hydrolase|tara:strand:- start:200 stop:631 length:432 start_codon:yes stop_codon:yes gene_type:complete
MDMMNLQRSDFDFWSSMKTRWRDMDALGHLNHAIYLEYMETARVDFYIQLGFSGIRKDMDESTILGSMDVHYLSQVKHPASLDVGHRICRVGSKSFDFLAAIFKKNEEKPVCSALFKMVAFNYDLNKAIPVPNLIREKCRPIK